MVLNVSSVNVLCVTALAPRRLVVCLGLLLVVLLSVARSEDAAPAPVRLAPHRAIYDLSLAAPLPKSSACAAAYFTISAAVPAEAIRSTFAKCRKSIPARARFRPAIYGRRPGKAPMPRALNSRRRTLLTRT